MKKILFVLLFWKAWTGLVIAQGPPILLDKPIMTGENGKMLHPMLLIANNKIYDFTALMLHADYNVTSNLSIIADLPIIFPFNNYSTTIGDMYIAAKYQFLRIDGLGKSIRVAAKAKNMFATGKKLETHVLGMGHNMTYVGLLGAREALKLGIQAEAGYNFSPSGDHLDHWLYKFGIGLPLLKPTYPVNQINLYFDFEGMNLHKHEGNSQYGYYYAQGIQYAKGRYTFDLSVQFPISQQFHGPRTLERKLWTLIAARVVI